VCAFACSEYASIGNKDFGKDLVQQAAATDQLRKLAPFFGHPLSLTLSNDAPLILEGEDDERVWQQAARSAQGRIRLFPVLATSVGHQAELETFCAEFLTSLYESPVAFSLRDGDGVSDTLAPVGPLRRFRLRCYAIENTLLTDECLDVLGTTWDKFSIAADMWASANRWHRDVEFVKELTNSSDRMRSKKIKHVRQLICGICDSRKPWEVVVGQALGQLDPEALPEGWGQVLPFALPDGAKHLVASFALAKSDTDGDRYANVRRSPGSRGPTPIASRPGALVNSLDL
jgi:hypothetical protein